ncbi:uncharacterized protein B0I36DRAFT_114817 [Microdochium trichocladiopsis]|uniref:Secreted protein n=1 Tax=Microdochium trichocladiopsis TaxID=1682393 RepID=A0A9P8Y5W3_9PEZI|nr:uncharacterized protein B0I36DRAFT_114817 [Microdochium trichocladiopsis]KAH7030849.1 hypothetical protein B0I36DRAFT_114817 [Microdochium trichocladiopsis]
MILVCIPLRPSILPVLLSGIICALRPSCSARLFFHAHMARNGHTGCTAAFLAQTKLISGVSGALVLAEHIRRSVSEQPMLDRGRCMGCRPMRRALARTCMGHPFARATSGSKTVGCILRCMDVSASLAALKQTSFVGCW